jgi:Skp family chaperone for outer membrane proteins
MQLRDSRLVVALVVAVVVCCLYVFFLNENVKLSAVPVVRVAVINSVRLKVETLCFREHDELEGMLSELVGRMHESEVIAKKEYEQVRSDKSLGKQQRMDAIEKIEENWAKISNQYKAEVEMIKKMNINLSRRLQKEIDQVIESIAQKYKIDIVLNTQVGEMISVFYSTKNVDMTDMVIDRLNKTVKHIDLEDLKE